jgi:hypothetical protein
MLYLRKKFNLETDSLDHLVSLFSSRKVFFWLSPPSIQTTNKSKPKALKTEKIVY